MTIKRNFKVSVSGVRGVVGETLTPTLAAEFAASFGEYVGRGKVVVGRDTRPTGELYENAVVAGLLSVGCQPVLIGRVPTPTVQMIVDEYNANGGIAITASHNPVEWNALKFISSSGVFLSHSEAGELLDVYNQQERAYVPEADYRNIRTVANPFAVHRRRLFKQIDIELIRRAGFKVAVDPGNGVGAFFSRQFLEDLGCDVVTVFDETDGIFRRKPEPAPQNITRLCELVREHHCDIGFAQDPDADRLVIVDNQGTPIGEQATLSLAVEHVLSKTPGTVVVNIQTSQAVEKIAAHYHCPLYYSRVGEINVTCEMMSRGAIIGGEGGSGGVIFPAVHPCRDSFTGMAILLEMMAARKKTVVELAAGLPQYVLVNDKKSCSAAKAFELIRRLKSDYAHCNPNGLDGLRLDFPDGWVLIRASNTEPIIRVSAEAQTRERAEALLAEFVVIIEQMTTA